MESTKLEKRSMATQFATFYVSGRLYGIDVMKVQEVLKAQPLTRMPLAPGYVHGLINLRGQIATAIGLRELFEITETNTEEKMNVVCRLNDTLISLMVDKIGDVMEVAEKDFEMAPDTVPESVRRFMSGVFKIQDNLMSVIEVEKVSSVLNTK